MKIHLPHRRTPKREDRSPKWKEKTAIIMQKCKAGIFAVLAFLRQKRVRTAILKTASALAILFFAALIMVLSVSGAIKTKTAPHILSSSDAPDILLVGDKAYDCIIVFGCLVRSSGEPSDMLRDRLAVAVELYHSGVAPKLLMSGDHGRESYDEVAAMKQFALDAGVPEEDIFMDHAGFSTYETIYRAKYIFGVRSAVLVTQEYHLHRALYIAESFSLDVMGVSASLEEYGGQLMRDIREEAARFKDFFYTLKKPLPTYLGDPIDIRGDGRVTEDD